MTVAGPSSGKRCIFPFTLAYFNITFNGCIISISPTGKSNYNPWCSTKVDDNGKHVRGGNWGDCSSKCPVEEGCNCKFPFTWGGITHDACTMHSSPFSDKPWCSLKVDDRGQHLVGYAVPCGKDCPVEGGCICKFPFTFNGVTHDACTMHGSSDGKPWCSLKVDDEGQHVEGIATKFSCGKDCPINENGKDYTVDICIWTS